jgi:hypothetical protein
MDFSEITLNNKNKVMLYKAYKIWGDVSIIIFRIYIHKAKTRGLIRKNNHKNYIYKKQQKKTG